MKNFAVLFDMDGVIVKSIPFHVKAWVSFGKKHGFKITRKMFLHHFSGRVNNEILKYLFKRNLTKKELGKFISEKESLYRKIYKSYVKPVRGLIQFLEELKSNKIKIALATAAPPENVTFILKHTRTEKYFKKVVNASHVKLGKPNPEIYLKSAFKIKTNPQDCIVFEDALNGIEAAKRAKMKVVGVATSHDRKEISHADLVIKDFTQINLAKLEALL